MRGNEHVAIAVTVTGGAAFALSGLQVDLATQLPAIGVAAIGSLVPDIDHKDAWIGNRIPATLASAGLMVLIPYALVSWMMARETSQTMGSALVGPLIEAVRPYLGLAWTLLGIGIALLVVSIFLSSVLEHRGPTHSLVVNAVLTVAATIVFAITGPSWTLGLWFGFGYLTHLLADMTTPMGCPSLLWLPVGSSVSMPVPSSMKRPGAQETGTPSQTTSTVASSSQPSLGVSEDLGASTLASGAPQSEGIEQHD